MTHHATSNLPLTEQVGRRADRRKPAPSRLFRVAAVAACLPVIGLAGCAKHSKDHFTVSSVKANYKERHPIVLKEQEQTLDVPVGQLYMTFQSLLKALCAALPMPSNVPPADA